MEDYYESPKGIAEYILFHFGKASDIFSFKEFAFEAFSNYPVRCVEECLIKSQLKPEGSGSRALDLGCAVGASTFQLGKYHDEVIGIDYSHAFIETAQKLNEGRTLSYEIPIEGNQTKKLTAQIDKKDIPAFISFEQGDACALRSDLGMFDTVFAGNLIDRLPDPSKFLQRLDELVSEEGQVILTSPYTWMEDYTPRELWIQSDSGENISDLNSPTFDGIYRSLSDKFALNKQLNIPFILREHQRKFQLTLAHASVWIKK